MGGKKLVLIHGALGTRVELLSLAKHLEDEYEVFLYEIPGHGSRSKELESFNFEDITKDFLNFLHDLGPSYIFGFSLGGYLAINSAQVDSSNIKGIVTLGTKFNWTPEAAKRETVALDLSFLKEKAPPFYKYLAKLHGEKLEKLLKATENFMIALGDQPRVTKQSVANIEIPLRICRGGRDKMVTENESVEIANSNPLAKYFEVPQFIHPIGFLDQKKVAKFLKVQLQSLSYNFFSFNEKEIAYQLINCKKKSENLLVFLHEALGSIAQWKNFPSKLCAELNLPGLVIEMHGYGFSSTSKEKRDENYLHNFALNDLPEILNGLAKNKKIIFVGHSDGGTNALLYSAKHNENVKGVCTLAAHVLNEPETRAGIPAAIKAFEEGKMSALEFYHGAKTEKVFFDWANTWLAPFFKNWNIENDIQNISAQGLIIQGGHDQYGTDEQVHKTANCFDSKVEQVFIENCGHSPHLEKSKEVLNIIKEWIEKLENGSN